MNMKKLIATALAVVMIFGLVSVGFAAVELIDIEDHEYASSIEKLAALGVIVGDPEGTFRPDDPVKRSEFAKMIVIMLGKENAAKLMQGEASNFSDVGPDHWASGFINVAELLGIVNGYPDGTFKPDNHITYTEAFKMVLCAMGYKEGGYTVLRWPGTWIIQAASLGLDEGIDVSPNLPITRGEVAKVFDNALVLPHVTIGEKGFEVPDPENPVTFATLLSVGKITGQVIRTPELWDWDEEEDEGTLHVFVAGEQKDVTYEFDYEDYEGLLGHKVEVSYKGDLVIGVRRLSTETVAKATDNKAVYEKVYDDRNVKCVFVNNLLVEAEPLETLGKEDKVAVVYEGKKPIAVKVLDYTVATILDIQSNTLWVKVGDVGSRKLALSGFDVVYEGAAEKFADLKKGDTINYIYDPDCEKAIINLPAPAETYTGKFKGATIGATTGEIEIDDKVFTLGTAGLADLSSKLPNLKEGTVITVTLEKGKVTKIDIITPTLDVFYGVVQAVRTSSGNKYAKILTLDGAAEYETDTLLKVGDVVYGVVYEDGKLHFETTVQHGKESTVLKAVYAMVYDAVYTDSAKKFIRTEKLVVKGVTPASGRIDGTLKVEIPVVEGVYSTVYGATYKYVESAEKVKELEFNWHPSETLWISGNAGSSRIPPVVGDKVILYVHEYKPSDIVVGKVY